MKDADACLDKVIKPHLFFVLHKLQSTLLLTNFIKKNAAYCTNYNNFLIKHKSISLKQGMRNMQRH